MITQFFASTAAPKGFKPRNTRPVVPNPVALPCTAPVQAPAVKAPAPAPVQAPLVKAPAPPARMPSKPRPPKNLNDDQKVDEYNFRFEQYENEMQTLANTASLSGTHKESRVQSATEYLQQIVNNIIEGDAVYKLSEMHLFVSDPDLIRKDSIVLLPSYERGFEKSDDYKVFESLVGSDYGSGSDLLASLMDSHASFAAAVPAIVSAGIAKGKISPGDKDRLTSLWRTWVKGVSWAKCKMSMTNRPSLGSWDGWPWEANQVMARCLMRETPQAASAIITTDISLMPYVMCVEDPELAFPLWHFESGPVDVSAVLRKALLATQALIDEDNEAKSAKSKPAKRKADAAVKKAKAKKPRHV